LEALQILLASSGCDLKRCESSSVLHIALAASSIPEYKDFGALALGEILQVDGGIALVNVKDDEGRTPLHLAVWANLPSCVQLLLDNGADQLIKDLEGNLPVHLGAKLGYCEIVSLLLSAQQDADNWAPRNNKGEVPLHLAVTSSHWEMASLLSKRCAIQLKKKDWRKMTPQDLFSFSQGGGNQLATRIFEGQHDGDLLQELKGENDPQTTIFYHPSSFHHHNCPPPTRETAQFRHPENLRRIHLIMSDSEGILKTAEFQNQLQWREGDKAPISDVLRVHEYQYIQKLKYLSLALPDDGSMTPLDGDTSLSHHSFSAALFGSGSVLKAVDEVMIGNTRNAFCAIRPPGHHAGPRGLVDSPNIGGEGSHGFCLINNIAVAAAYLMNVHRHHGIEKVAIIDFDVRELCHLPFFRY